MNILDELKRYHLLLGVLTGLAYGVAVRLYAGLPSDRQSTFGVGISVMTAGFVLVMPAVMGWLTVAGRPAQAQSEWGRWIFAPWLTVLLGCACTVALKVEGLICVVFALPVMLLMSSLGGIVAGFSARRLSPGARTTFCLGLLPLLVASVELHGTAPTEIRAVHSSILIHAPVPLVWANVERVRAIRPDEIRPTWAHRVGFPLPVEATLDREGVGGVRHATFEHGLLFVETITRWEPLERIGFSIVADTAHIPPTTLDEHVTIGGSNFDVLDGEYRLEPLAGGNVLLHLTSHERISTDFNWYAALWSDGVMSDLQESILEVEKRRCERGELSATLNP